MAYPDYTNNFDSKWKDQSTPCKYDVDDPTFCSPMSVLSGLVSGFCERQAVVNSNFVTGTTASPVTVDWSATTQASRDAIVNSCVQHVAAHDLLPSQVGAESYKGPVSAAFMPADHDAKVDGNVMVDTTYMTHMDNLITSLVETGEYRTDLTGGTAYTTFSQLASSASAAVAGTVSAITSVPVQGGTNYSQEFMPSFPKEWAKERKWMLEQLRYTGGGIEQAMVNGVYVNCFSGDTEVRSYMSETYDDQWIPVGSLALAYDHVVSNNLTLSGVNMGADRAYTTFNFSAAWHTHDVTGDYGLYALVPDYGQKIGLPYGMSCTLKDADWITHSGTSAYVNVYIGAVGGIDDPGDYFREESAVKISGASTYAIPENSGWIPVVILSGGTATISSGGTNLIGSVTISSGGTLIVGQNVSVGTCNVMCGGKYIQEGTFTNGGSYTDGIETVFCDYRSCHGDFFYDPSSAIYVSGGTVGATSTTGVMNYFVENGGILIGSSRTATCYPDAYEIAIQSGGTVKFSSYKWKSAGDWQQVPAYTYNCMIHSGGSLIVSGFSRSLYYYRNPVAGATMIIAAGGAATVTCAEVYLYLLPGGSANITDCCGLLYVHGGATLNMSGYVLSGSRLHPMCYKDEGHVASTAVMNTFAFGGAIVSGWNSYLVNDLTKGTEYWAMPSGMIAGTTDSVAGASALLSGGIQNTLADLSVIGGTCAYVDIEDCTPISTGYYEDEDSAWVKLDDEYMPHAGMKYYPNGGTTNYTSYASGTYFYGYDGYVYLLPQTTSVMPTASALASYMSEWVHWGGMKVLAVNGGTMTVAPCVDHYKEFKLRQNAT